LPGGVDTTILVFAELAMGGCDELTGAGRVRLDLDELVDAGLDVAAFCAAASPLVARAVPSSAGAAESPNLVCRPMPSSCRR
jgi:hypothetical protein